MQAGETEGLLDNNKIIEEIWEEKKESGNFYARACEKSTEIKGKQKKKECRLQPINKKCFPALSQTEETKFQNIQNVQEIEHNKEDIPATKFLSNIFTASFKPVKRKLKKLTKLQK